MQINYKWDDEKDNELRIRWGTVTAYQIGHDLSPQASAKQVYRRARRLNLTRPRYGWSLVDDQVIYDNADRLHPSEMIGLLSRRRSEDCVRWRMSRLGIKARNNGDWLHATAFAAITGINRHWINQLVKLGLLKATKYNPMKHTKGGWYKILKEDAIDFCRKYPGELQGRNANMVALIDLLVGIKVKIPTNGNYYPDIKETKSYGDNLLTF